MKILAVALHIAHDTVQILSRSIRFHFCISVHFLQFGRNFLLSELLRLIHFGGDLLDLLNHLSFELLNVDVVHGGKGDEGLGLGVLAELLVELPLVLPAVDLSGLTVGLGELIGKVVRGFGRRNIGEPKGKCRTGEVTSNLVCSISRLCTFIICTKSTAVLQHLFRRPAAAL